LDEVDPQGLPALFVVFRQPFEPSLTQAIGSFSWGVNCFAASVTPALVVFDLAGSLISA